MDRIENGPWEVVRELGLEYEAVEQRERSLDLNWPVSAERVDDDKLLIVDELDVHNGVPFSFRCRTLVLSEKRSEIIYDSSAAGFDDGYGCKIDDEKFAILRRTSWEIVILRYSGEIFTRIDLAKVSKRIPRLLGFTHNRTFLLACFSKSHQIDLVELDLRGRVLWYLPRCPARIGAPGSMQLLKNGNVLVADEFRHVVHEVKRDGKTVVRMGVWADPSREPGHLSNPKAARELDDGTLLIADSNNHRAIRLGPGGLESEIVLGDRELLCPSCVREDGVGRYIICDAANHCVWSVDQSGASKVLAGAPVVRTNQLSFPRSVQYLAPDRYLVADTARNRIVLYSGTERQALTATNVTPLFWPRAARMTANGSVLIADGRNSRVIEMSSSGQIIRELTEVRSSGKLISLKDPHDVRSLENDRVLVTDSAAGIVFEADWDGSVKWIAGRESEKLNDPHSAQMMADGRVVIADSGNHRILFVNPDTGHNSELNMAYDGKSVYRLHYPRYAEVCEDNTLVIVDSGNNRILICNLKGEMDSELSSVHGSPVTTFQFPRWAHLLNRQEMIVTDHFRHRILHLRNSKPS